MTENQSNLLVKNPNTKKALIVLKKFAAMEAQYKELEKESKNAAELIKQAMIDNNVTKVTINIEGLTGYITLATRIGYKAEDIESVSDEYLKPTLDTNKIKAKVTLTGEIPEGIEVVETQYLTKKFKAEN